MLLVIAVVASWAAMAAWGTEVRSLPNGLRIVWQAGRDSDAFGICFSVAASAADEAEEPGLPSVMAEGLLLGSDELSGPAWQERLADWDDRGVRLDVLVGEEAIELCATGSTDLETEVCRALVRIITHPLLPEDKLGSVVERLKAEQEETEKGAQRDVYRLARQVLDPDAPDLQRIDPAALQAITRSDLVVCTRRLLVGKRLVVGLVTRRPEGETAELLAGELADLPAGEPASRGTLLQLIQQALPAGGPADLPYRSVVREVEGIQSARVMVAYSVPGVPDPDFPIAQLVETLLGAPGFGAYSRDAFLLSSARVGAMLADRTMRNHLAAYAVTFPPVMEQIRQRLVAPIEGLSREPVPPSLLEAGRRRTVGSQWTSVQTNLDRARRMARGELLGLGPDADEAAVQAIHSATPEDVHKFALRYLGPNQYALVVLLPVVHRETDFTGFPELPDGEQP